MRSRNADPFERAHGDQVEIRRGGAADAPELTRLARLAKASWGYPEAWLREWDPELKISPEYIVNSIVFVAMSDESIVGVIGVGLGSDGPEIEHLWITPEHQGQGIGRALVDRVREVAKEEHWDSLRIVSDPYARAFYERLGARRVGETAAPVAGTNRTLPILELET